MSEAFYCQTQDLAIGYGKTPLLQNIGIGVQRGQILALIGPNGAGKSTLLKTLAGQLAPLGGTVLLDGQALTAYSGTAPSVMPEARGALPQPMASSFVSQRYFIAHPPDPGAPAAR